MSVAVMSSDGWDAVDAVSGHAMRLADAGERERLDEHALHVEPLGFAVHVDGEVQLLQQRLVTGGPADVGAQGQADAPETTISDDIIETQLLIHGEVQSPTNWDKQTAS